MEAPLAPIHVSRATRRSAQEMAAEEDDEHQREQMNEEEPLPVKQKKPRKVELDPLTKYVIALPPR